MISLLAAILAVLISTCTGVIQPSCLAFRELETPSKQPELFNCPQYRDLSCCGKETDSRIIPNQDGQQLYGFNWDRCGKLSDACFKFFQAESCYFECDPYMAPWGNRAYENPVGVVGIPLCSSYCNAWYDACKDDLTCGAEWLIDFVKVSENDTAVRYDCPAEGVCKKFSQVYTSPQGLCDILWGSAFHYSEDESNCVTWDFGLTQPNPNALVEPQEYAESYCDKTSEIIENVEEEDAEHQPQCLPGREFSEPKAVKGLQKCSAFEDLSCCGENIDKRVIQHWDSCGQKLSDSCQAYFDQYECYFECDPYMYIFGANDFANPTTPFGVPLCADTCNGWYEACKDDLVCGSELFLDFSYDGEKYECYEGTRCIKFSEMFDNSQSLCDNFYGSYFHYSDDVDNCVVWDFEGNNPNEHVVKKRYSEGRCPDKDQQRQPYKNSTIALAITLGVVVVLSTAFIALLIIREKRQNPLFSSVPMQKLGN